MIETPWIDDCCVYYMELRTFSMRVHVYKVNKLHNLITEQKLSVSAYTNNKINNWHLTCKRLTLVSLHLRIQSSHLILQFEIVYNLQP